MPNMNPKTSRVFFVAISPTHIDVQIGQTGRSGPSTTKLGTN
jgi:hypothetical protein